MKKQIIVFLCITIIGLSNTTNLVIANNLKEIKSFKVDEVPVWKPDDSWTFYVNRLQTNFSLTGAVITLDASMDNLTVKVIGYSELFYILGLSGDIKGNFYYESSEGMVVNGYLLFTKTSGNIYVRKNNLAIEKTQIVIKGIVLITRRPTQIPIPIPLPLTITINIKQNTTRPFIDFPLYDGKQGTINETVISIDIRFDSIVLQFLSFFFESIPYFIYYKQTYNIPMLNYTTKNENISVTAGMFNTYNISFSWDLFGSIYYAPLVGNIIKIESVLDIPDQFLVLCICELKDYNYQIP